MCDSSENREDLLPQKAFIGLACRAGTEGFKERIICLLLSCELNIECKKGIVTKVRLIAKERLFSFSNHLENTFIYFEFMK